MAEWAADPKQPWTRLDFDQFGLHAALEVKTIQALYYKSGRDRLLTIVLVHDVEGKRPDQMFYCTKLDWTAREILSAYACRWAIECTFEFCKQFLGLEDPANRLPKAVERTAPMAMFIYTIVVVWFHRTGHRSVQFPFRPWYKKKAEPSFADMLTTLRRLSYDEKTEGLLPEPYSTENLDCPAHRASQPDRVSGRSARDSRVIRDFTTDPTGQISPAGPLAVRSPPCETGTWGNSRKISSS